MEGSGSSNSQVTYQIVNIRGESEEDDPGGRLLAVFHRNWTLA
jgi:hypothetical protein